MLQLVHVGSKVISINKQHECAQFWAMISQYMEIYRNDGLEFTSIISEFNPDGTLTISGHDMGPLVEHFEDYEYDLFIPKESVERFLLNFMPFAFNNEKKQLFQTAKTFLKRMKLIIHSTTGRREMWRFFMVKNLFDFVLVVKNNLELELQWFERNMYKKGFDWTSHLDRRYYCAQ